MRLGVLCFGLIALMGCQPETPDGPGVEAGFDKVQCLAAGGVVTSGMRGPVCAKPTQDAGQSCTAETACEGFCLAETKTCTPHTPYFGCFAVLVGEGEATLCVD